MNHLSSRQRFFVVAAIAALVVVVVLLSSRTPIRHPHQNGSGTTEKPLETKAAVVSSGVRPSPVADGINASSNDDAPGRSPAADRPRFLATNLPAQRKTGQGDVTLQVAATSLRAYRIAFSQNPVGNNVEITRALSGKNARQTRYLSADARMNDKGELIDRWDQPIFFHQISANQMEIRSAGPDRRMWTSDDEVLR